MKKLLFALLLCLGTMLSALAQNTASDLLNNERDYLYINTFLNTKDEVNALSRNFSVDNCSLDERTGLYKVRVYLSRHEYSDFLAQNLPFEIISDAVRANAPMATTIADMANWNKYPIYEVYVQMMQNFQTNFPNLCKIDTILAATPCTRPHMLLAAHISTTLGQAADKPAFLYSATMHGDEVVGFHMMLRLIDYLLNNATTDQQVQNILQNVDLYICPLENPDGTYHNSNSQIGYNGDYSQNNPSIRYNWNNVDLNRNYPFLPGVSGSANVQPETQAIINWVEDKHFVMSANFHGGAELTNFPWDSWSSQTRTHADDAWFRYICQNYVDACQSVDATYMGGESGVGNVTEGGDWYVITGSRQDYMNYYQHCREVTMEVHSTKMVTDASDLVTYFPNSKNALLNYIMECTYGFRGIVTDAVTGEPIDNAKIFVRDHDTFNSEVYSHLPLGTYYRPIKAGTYTVEVSADCYQTQSFTVTTTDGASVRRNVRLQPIVTTPQVEDAYILSGETATLTAASTHTINWYASATATTPLATGTSFTTPALTATTTYYVEEQAVDNTTTCVSERDTVYVFVSDVPRDTVYGSLEVEECVSFEFAGETLTETGDYDYFYPGPAGSFTDSIFTLHLVIHPAYQLTVSETVNVGDTYYVEGTPHYANLAGTFTYNRLHYSVYGCDSIMQYVFYVVSENAVYGELPLEECAPFSYEGEVLLMDGDYTFYYPGAGVGGADSTLVIHLTLHPSYEQTLDVQLAIGEHYMVGDYDFYSDDNGFFQFDKEFETVFGCDSVVHYNITVGTGVPPIGIAEGTFEGVTLYPNPVSDVCRISGLASGIRTNVCIFNVFGQKVKEVFTENEDVTIDMSGLKAGVYSVQLVQNGANFVLKFIKL